MNSANPEEVHFSYSDQNKKIVKVWLGHGLNKLEPVWDWKSIASKTLMMFQDIWTI
jgi:hypothetical protein